MVSITDHVLPRLASGDQAAVDECLARYGGLVWSIARRLTKNLADAEDAVQEIFVELWQHAGRFDPGVSSEATFITMIARRRLIDRHRRQQRSLETSSLGDDDGICVAEQPRDAAAMDDEATKASACFRDLKADQRQVLELVIYHGVSHAKIAHRLGMPIGTVKSSARRGMILLRDCMKRKRVSQLAGRAT